MNNMRTRVNSILVNAQCFIRNDEIISWQDARPQPSEEELLAVDVDAIIADNQAKAQETEDELVNSPITGITYAQAEAYIDSNVSDAGTAKVCKKMARLLLAIAKKQGLSD